MNDQKKPKMLGMGKMVWGMTVGKAVLSSTATLTEVAAESRTRLVVHKESRHRLAPPTTWCAYDSSTNTPLFHPQLLGGIDSTLTDLVYGIKVFWSKQSEHHGADGLLKTTQLKTYVLVMKEQKSTEFWCTVSWHELKGYTTQLV